MAYDSETFEVLHELTDSGRETYRAFLEEQADLILYRHEHPFRHLLERVLELFGIEV